MEKVFITDGLWRKSLAAVRALGRAGFAVTVGEKTPLASALFSKYPQKRLVYPNPATQAQKFLDFILAELEAEKYAALLAMEEETLLLLDTVRPKIEKSTLFPFPPGEAVRALRDKGRLEREGSGLGFAFPRTALPQDREELKAAAGEIPAPWVLKPSVSSGSRGRFFAETLPELLRAFSRLQLLYPQILLQEKIPGEVYGCSGLGDKNGGLKAFFAHRRLMTYPYDGGPATLAESVRDPELEKLTRDFFAAFHWFGVGQLEVIKDARDGSLKLIEFNPRFWGSLHLAVSSGVNFPLLLIKTARGENFPFPSYPSGVKGGWFFPGGVLRALSRPLPGFPDLFRHLGAKDFVASRDDALPLLGKLLSALNWPFFPELRRALRK